MCGGTLRCDENQSSYRCEYYHSVAVISDLPLLVDGIKPTDQAMNSPCPSCFGSLQSADLDGRKVVYCPDCFGMLVRRDHFAAIVRERRSKRSGQEQEIPKPIDPSVYSRRLRCPVCDRYMETHPYYGPGNVVIDSCGECSRVWLDHGELARVERAAGGREPGSLFMPTDMSCFTAFHEPEVERHPIAVLADFLF